MVCIVLAGAIEVSSDPAAAMLANASTANTAVGMGFANVNLDRKVFIAMQWGQRNQMRVW